MDSFKGSQVEAVVRSLLGEPNRALSTKSELRYGSRGSLVINLPAGTWFDHEKNRGGGLIDLYCETNGGSRRDAAEWLKTHGITLPGQRDSKPRIVKTYDYRDEAGELSFQVVRFEPKAFRQRRPDPKGGWIWSTKGSRRMLYRLPELIAADPTKPVYLVEGEKDADRLAACGLVATTNPGGANKWRDDYNLFLAGRKVIVLADNDAAGEAHAQLVTSALAGITKSVVHVPLAGLSEKADVSDWLDAGGRVDDLERTALEALSSSPVNLAVKELNPSETHSESASSGRQGPEGPAPEPIPLLRADEPAVEVPIEHLGPLKSAVEALQVLTQAPLAICLQSVLGVASVSVQGLADVESLAGPVPTSLALLTIAQSGERKSACDKLALASLRETEQARYREFLSAQETHQLDNDVHEAERKAILKHRDVTERDVDLDALGPPPPPPLSPSILFGDPTLEGLLRHFDEGQPSVGVFSDEGGLLFGGNAMNSENKLKTAAAYSKLWDGSEINRARASASATRYYGRRLASHLMVQPLIAEKLLADQTIRDQGLLSRMLFSWPESRIGYRSAAPDEACEAAQSALDTFHDRIRRALEQPLPTGPDPRELSPRDLPLSVPARTILEQFAISVEAAQRPDGPCAGIRGVASKAAEQAARIAGVMVLFDNPEAGEVPPEMMAAAVGLSDWYLREARRLLDTGPIKGRSADAELLRDWLVERWKENEIDIRSMVRLGPRRLRDTSEIKALVGILVNYGWLVPVNASNRKAVWRVVRP